MTFPPVLAALIIPAGLFAAWLYLHKDADIEQRIDKKEAIHQRDSAEFDRDFARLTNDDEGKKTAKIRIEDAENKINKAEVEAKKREKTDQRAAVRDGVDEFLKPTEVKK